MTTKEVLVNKVKEWILLSFSNSFDVMDGCAKMKLVTKGVSAEIK